MKKKFNTFAEFYPFYIAEHSHPVSRRFHFTGSWLVLLSLVYIVYTSSWSSLWVLLIFGYGCAWIGHFFYEKNTPATFTYPLYSLMGDWVMFRGILLGKIDLSSHIETEKTNEAD